MSGLPPGWIMSTVGQVGEVSLGRQRAPKYHHGEGMRPYLRVANVFEDRIDTTDVMQMTFSDDEFERYRLQPGDVLLNEGQSPHLLGRPAIYRGQPPDVAFTNSLIRFRVWLGVTPEWALAVFRHYMRSRRFMRESRITTNIAHLSATRFSTVEFPVPPVAEQRRIVAAIEEQFSRLDAGVAALERAQQNIKRMRSAAFALIADSVDAWLTLGEIAEVVGGVTKDAKRQSDPSFVEVPYLRVANVQRGYLDLSAVTTIRVPTTTVEKLRLEPGDILFNEGGDRDKLGRGWIWEGKIKDCIHQNHVFRARLLTDNFDPRFVSMHGNTFGRTWFEKMGKQTTNLASLNLTTLKSFPVPDLPVERQREIVAEVERRLSLIGSLQSAADDSLTRCNSLRSSILAAAFSGRLVPQDSTDEPASALLERIAAERASSNGNNRARTRKPRTPREKAVI
jgi:type I restriction enzyme S subunit